MHSEEYCSIASYTSSVRLRLPPSPTGEGFVFRKPLRLPATVTWSPCEMASALHFVDRYGSPPPSHGRPVSVAGSLRGLPALGGFASA